MHNHEPHSYTPTLIAPIGERGNASGVNLETLNEREQRITELTWKLRQAWQELLEQTSLATADNTFNTKHGYLEALREKDQLYIALGRGATMSCYPAAIVDGEEIAGSYHVPTRHDVNTGMFVGFEDGSTALSEQNSNHALLNKVASTHTDYQTLFAENHSEEDTKQYASDFKASFVDIANTHAGGETVSSVCKVASKRDINGVREAAQLSVTFSPATMASYAERTRYKHTHDYIHEEVLLKEFLTTLELNEYNSAEGYLAIANKVYGGDMTKAYKNISAVATMTGQRMPDGWRAFAGNANDFRTIEGELETVEAGAKGYIALADALYGGAMKKAYENISAVTKMTGQRMPEGWRTFTGTADEFRAIEAQLETVEAGIEGYIALADALYGGNMTKTYQNTSAVVKMTGQRMPEGWRRFAGTTHEFRAIEARLGTTRDGIQGYIALADALYDGNMRKTYVNISAVANMTGQRMPEGWQVFVGTTDDFHTIEAKLEAVEDGVTGYIALADALYDRDMDKTYVNISAVTTMTGQRMPEGWRTFTGTTDDFRAIEAQLETVGAGIEGYITLADALYSGAMRKTYRNISAVAKMTGQRMPEGWQYFEGTTDEFRAIEAQLETVEAGIAGYIALADALYGGNMQKTYQNISAVANMTGQRIPEGWRQFEGTTNELHTIETQLGTVKDGLEGCIALADALYDGNMRKTYQNISAVAKMTGQRMPEGWQVFAGTTDEFHTIEAQLETVEDGIEGYITLADALYGGDMQKTYQNISAVANMTGQRMPEGWQKFASTTDEFRAIETQLETVEAGIAGYIALADALHDGNMRKTYVNISAVAVMTEQRIPEGWQQFTGTTNEFRAIEARLDTVKDGLEGYITLADALYDGNMRKTYQNISAVAKMTGQRMPEGWQVFAGTTQAYAKQQAWLSKYNSVQRRLNIVYDDFYKEFYPDKESGIARGNYLAICHMQGWL